MKDLRVFSASNNIELWKRNYYIMSRMSDKGIYEMVDIKDAVEKGYIDNEIADLLKSKIIDNKRLYEIADERGEKQAKISRVYREAVLRLMKYIHHNNLLEGK